MISRIALYCLCFTAAPAFAQMPFDMSPELYLRDTPAAPAIVEETQPSVLEQPQAPAQALQRHLLPQTGVRFEGEVGSRAFNFYLTAEQASAPAQLDLSVLNAIVVAPEYSRLAVEINGTQLAATPISFATGPASVAMDVPEGVLVPGQNRILLHADQRHRTDCSINSTYELWTEIYAAQTVLSFEGEGLGEITALEDLPAIGLNENGETVIRLLVPQLETAEARAAALRLVQHLALAVKAPAVKIELIDTLDAAPDGGVLTAILATADALPGPVADFAGQARGGPVAGMMDAREFTHTLLISGPDWSSVEIAIGSIGTHVQQADGDLMGLRVDLPYSVPMITGAATVPLSQLGVETVEFNGRRFHSEVRFALPDDFYANMYSEAELVLDAAYTAAVQPGSQLEIYVNGQIATVAPILRMDGGTLRDARLRIPMTNFRPGINEMHVETILQTGEDQACPPGLSGRASPRFLFSAASQLSFPDFARIAQYPDLRALSGTGAPYAGAGEVPLVLADDAASLEAAMMLLSRLAISSGQVIEPRVVDPEALDPTSHALIVGPMPSLPSGLLARGRVAEPVDGLQHQDTDEDPLERWRQAAGDGSRTIVETMRDGIADWLGLAPENFWLLRRTDGAYLPQSSNAVVLSQAHQPEGGVWTTLTIPDPDAFTAATARLTSHDTWEQVAGKVSAVGAEDAAVLVVRPRNVSLVPTQPFSLANFRLIAANWLSTNVLGYALVLAIGAILVTVATSLLLGTRRR